ncbi:MAG: TonB-dependent receptor plug domain-containing protein, partial [Achromobacter pestifer]
MNFPTLAAGARAPLRAFALRPLALACLYALPLALPAAARAQAAPDTATLSPVIITANPLGSDALASPSTILQGQELDLRRGSNLGETLNGLPGVSTTSYGPMVGRPIIRGLDGDRIRLLNNGVGTLDASSLSFDHAVPQD